jgi:hypothetical protein
MDPDISSAKRLVCGAVALHYSAEERSRGVRTLPAARFDSGTYQQMLNSCSQEREIRKLIDGVGMTFGPAQKGKAKVRLELQSPTTSAPLPPLDGRGQQPVLGDQPAATSPLSSISKGRPIPTDTGNCRTGWYPARPAFADVRCPPASTRTAACADCAARRFVISPV